MRSPTLLLASKRSAWSLLLSATTSGACAALTASLVTPIAYASPEMDRQYAIKTVGFLRAVDNVDGLFESYVAKAFQEYFVQNSRFTLTDLSKADDVLSGSKIPYAKLIQDNQILGKLSRVTRAESILRTKIFKEGPRYRFTIEWLHSPKMIAMATEIFFLEQPKQGESLSAAEVTRAIQKGLDDLLTKIPFVGQITGRDAESVTVDIGESAKLKSGDKLSVATLEEIKKHPLLNTVVEWRMVPVGTLEVETVDRGLAFCKVTEQEEGKQIARFQKITQITPKLVDLAQDTLVDEEAEARKRAAETPRLGWISGGPTSGTFSRLYSSSNGSTGKDGGGFLVGAKADGQLWLNRKWFIESSLGYGTFDYSQKNIATGADTGVNDSGTLLSYRLSLGYTYFVAGNFFGPKGFLKLGYRNSNYTLATQTAENTAPSSFSSLSFGIGADLPVRNLWGLLLNLDFGILRNGTETGATNVATTGATDVEFYLGTYYRLKPKMSVRAGVQFVGHGLDYSNSSTLTHRAITVAPELVFYF